MSAHWRKAPLALRHHPSALLAVAAAALLVALAASSSPFVTTAVASEALKTKLNELTPFSTGLQLRYEGLDFRLPPGKQLAAANARDAHVAALARRLPHTGPPVFTAEAGPVEIAARSGDVAVVLMARDGAVAHVQHLASVAGPGVWISNIVAETAHLRPGDRFRLDTARRPIVFRVKGIYHALAQGPLTPYWTNFYEEEWPQTLDASPPPSYVFMSRSQVYGVDAALTSGGGANFGPGTVGIEQRAELPVDPKGMTLPAARELDTRFRNVHRALHSSFGEKLGCLTEFTGPSRCVVLSSLSSAVALARQDVAAVSPIVTLLADIGVLIALAVAAAAGTFLVRRRAGEASLLYARGESVATFASRTLAETVLPTVAGGAAGFGIAYAVTTAVAPNGSLDGATVGAGAWHAAAGVAIGLVLLVAAAALAFARLFDTGLHSLPWLRYLPWELPALGVALYLLFDLRGGGGLSGGHPTLAVFVFPLLFVAAVTGLVLRVAVLPLRSRRIGRVRNTVAFLALRRLGAARGLLVVLTIVCAVAFGALFYAETLSGSLSHTTIEKAYIANGSDVQGTIQQAQSLPPSFPYAVTKVEYANQGIYVDNEDTPAYMLVVDPATLVPTLHWQSNWGPSPAGMVHALGAAPTRPLPVIVTADAAHMRAAIIGDFRFPVRVVGTVPTFPDATPGVPLVITSFHALAAEAARRHIIDPLDVPFTYVWAKGPTAPVSRALEASPLHPFFMTTVDTFLRDPDVVLATRTYSFMRIVAIAAGVLVLIGVLLYLQARQRSQVIASALARRMGLSRRSETLSLGLELAVILFFAGIVGGAIAIAAARPVVPRLDPLPLDPPPPVFSFPTLAVALTAVALAVFTLAAAAVTSWLARRRNVSEAIRVV